MSVSKATKLRWFHQGAAALAQAIPDPALRDTPYYVCPLCFAAAEFENTKLFNRAAVDERVLTVEHVPPECFGGKGLLLTCRPCNNDDGARLDSDARSRENLIQVFSGRTERPVRVRMRAGMQSVCGDLGAEGKTLDLKMPPLEANANNPAELQALGEFLPTVNDDTPFNLTFYDDAHSPQSARASWLRTAYLALFAIAGYRYIFGPSLEIVRRQIREPEAEHIPAFLVRIPEDRRWSDRRIIHVQDSEWKRCWAVQVGPWMVFLPESRDTEFYDRLATGRRDEILQTTITGDVLAWPTQPFFGLVPEDS